MRLPRGIRDVRRLQLGPDDKLVVRVTRPLTEEFVTVIHEQVKARFPAHEVIVLNPDVDLTVIRPPGPTDPGMGSS